VPNHVPVPRPHPPPSETEQKDFKRIVAAWQARHERIRSFSIAWDSPAAARRNPDAGPLSRHTELWVDQGLRFRFLTSSPPNALPYQETFDGMTHRTWNPEMGRCEVWNGEPRKGRAYGDSLIWRIGVDPLSIDLVDISSTDFNVLSEDEIIGGLRQRTLGNEVIPVYCGTAFKNKGVQAMLDAVVQLLPSPSDRPPVAGIDEDDQEITRKAEDSAPFSALAFKIMTDPFVGSLTFFRVYSGTLKSGDAVYNPVKSKKERIGRILQMHANERQELKEVCAGHRCCGRPEGRDDR